MTQHGLAQSEALTLAAQKLSRAKDYLTTTAELFNAGALSEREVVLGEERLLRAQEAYDAAYIAYTNPFKVDKTF